MESTATSAEPSSGPTASVDADTYFRWLEHAHEAHKHGTDVGASLRSIGVPTADVEAIVPGISIPRRESTSSDPQKAVSPSGLPDNARDVLQRAATQLPADRRSGSTPRRTLWALLVALCLVALLALAIRRPKPSPQSLPTPVHAQSDVPAATRQLPAPHLMKDAVHKTHHTFTARPLRAAPRETDESVQDLSHSTSASIMEAPHPETCPPGVDRLGCPSIAGRSHRPQCPYGSLLSGDSCQKIDVPPHAHFEPAGLGWACDAGYVLAEASCTKLRVPQHAHLDFTGRGWQCDPGFEHVGDGCLN